MILASSGFAQSSGGGFSGTLFPGTVPDRATLNAILVTSSTETFEELGALPNKATVIPSPLVTTGLTVSYSATPFLIVYGAGDAGQPSTDVSGDGTGGPTLTFTTPTTTFGLDLLGVPGATNTVQVSVLGLDDVTLLYQSPNLTLLNPVAPVFFGYEDRFGIGQVRIVGGGEPTAVDNITYGRAAPEPGTVALAATALTLTMLTVFLRRRRPATAAVRSNQDRAPLSQRDREPGL